MVTVKTHVMFQGKGEEAVNLYASVFKDFQIKQTELWTDGEPGTTGAFKLAHVSFAGHELIIFDSPPMHDFTFTPSMSLYVDFDSQADLKPTFDTLSKDGQIMMPLGDYGFSKQFAWIADRFGMSWQLSVPH